MSVSKIAYRYGKSLMDIAQEQGKLDRIVGDIEALLSSCENDDFRNLLDSPIVKVDKKLAIFKEIFGGKVDDLSLTYFEHIIAKGREGFLPQIAASFIDQYKKLQHTTTVKLTTAQVMEDEVLKSIQEKLEGSNATDDKVELELEIDPDLIGGFMLDFEGMRYDGSVRKRLADLKQSFSK